MKTAIPMHMPKSVVTALARIWRGEMPANMSTICYTYGDTLYTPNAGKPIEKHLLKHEMTHVKQQGSDPDAWWDMYGKSPQFRYEQELEAYRNQYKSFKNEHGKIKAYEFAKYLANDMSSPMYGGMCTGYQALQDILRA